MRVIHNDTFLNLYIKKSISWQVITLCSNVRQSVQIIVTHYARCVQYNTMHQIKALSAHKRVCDNISCNNIKALLLQHKSMCVQGVYKKKHVILITYIKYIIIMCVESNCNAGLSS